jgi:hypothetical protein
VAEVTEPAEEVLDKAMAAVLGGTVTRRPASDVYAEVVAAEKAEAHEDVDAVVLGLVVMVWGLGYAQMKVVLSKEGRQAPR